jgi:hypothetical protein
MVLRVVGGIGRNEGGFFLFRMIHDVIKAGWTGS